MPEDDGEETYSVIFSALKHPVRRRILRMLSEEELTYTQVLTRLDIDTGHLNYHLESLGELVSKTEQGKYRLSEFGKAALGLMSGVEETETSRQKSVDSRSSRRRIMRWSQIVPVIALVIAGIILMNVSYAETYRLSASGSLAGDDVRIIQPNATITTRDYVNVRHFHADTLTTHYRTFFQIDVACANVTAQIQLTENIDANGPTGPNIHQLPLLLYNQTWNGPLQPESGTTVSYTIQVPLASPIAQGYLLGSGFAVYETAVTNLGRETVVNDSLGNGAMVTVPNHTGSLSLQTSYPVIEETDYPYFYYGVAFIVIAVTAAVLSCLLALTGHTGKKAAKIARE